MTAARSDAPLAQMFAYNAWANARIIDACRVLTGAQFDAPVSGAFGSIRETLLHVVYGQYSTLTRLDGRAQDPRSVSPMWPGFDVLTAVEAETSSALIEAAAALGHDSEVVLAYMGKSYRYPRSFFLAHGMAHGVEHRTQISVVLAQLGLRAPNLDGWEFAGYAGLGVEV